MNGWLRRWELTGWKSATGKRVRHVDIWTRIMHWLRLFESAPDRQVQVMHVKAHAGTHGNERADSLAKEGAELRFKLVELAMPNEWFQSTLNKYWTNRTQD